MSQDIIHVPNIICIAAMAANGVIGNSEDNTIPWRKDKESIKMYSWDMLNFKNYTQFTPVIMGYNTMKSLKNPLPYRYNIVIDTRYNTNINPMNDLLIVESNEFICVNSIKQALQVIFFANKLYGYEFDKTFVIGGAKTYEKCFEDKLFSNLILTSLDQEYEGDVYFPTKYIKEYSEYETNDFRNGDIRKFEIIDPEYKERIFKYIL